MSYSRALSTLKHSAHSKPLIIQTNISFLLGMLFTASQYIQSAFARNVNSVQFSQDNYHYGVEHTYDDQNAKSILHALIDACGAISNITYEAVIPFADPGSKHFIAQVETKNHPFLNEVSVTHKIVSFWRENTTHINATQEACFISAADNELNKDEYNIGVFGVFLIIGISLYSLSLLVSLASKIQGYCVARQRENHQPDIEMQPQSVSRQRDESRTRHRPRHHVSYVQQHDQPTNSTQETIVSPNETRLEALGINTKSNDYARYIRPITQQVMTDPYSTTNGNTYEYRAIELWLSQHDTDPVTGERLTSKALTPNRPLKNIIDEHIENLTKMPCRTLRNN